jgi:hypothetical protein
MLSTVIAGSGDLPDDRRAGRRDQLPFDVQFSPGNAAQDLGGGRRGQGESAVGTFRVAVEGGHRTGDDLRPAEHLETQCRSDDVDDGVHGPHLVEVNLFRRAAVDPAFGLREPQKDSFSRPFHAVGELRAADHLPNVLQPPVMVVMAIIQEHADVRRLDRPGHLFPHLDPVTAHAEAGETFPEPLRVRPRADERPERHVAADARKTVEICDLHR